MMAGMERTMIAATAQRKEIFNMHWTRQKPILSITMAEQR
jgi:hypothetical protein